MALDRRGVLLTATSEELIASGRLEVGVHVLRPGLALFATRPIDLSTLRPETLLKQPYKTLEEMGALALDVGDSAGVRGSVELCGGSVCTTVLERSENRWVVAKQLTGSEAQLDAVDSAARHRAEAAWLASRRGGKSDPFPSTRVTRWGEHLRWEMEFIPRYTLGERIVQGRESAASVMGTIRGVVEALAATVYGRRRGAKQPSYLDIVERRFNRLSASDTSYATLWYSGGIINGRRCRPIRSLIAQAREELPDIAHPQGGRGCHGDLIFENILPPGIPHTSVGVRLVDPNPANSSPLVDLAKILMNVVSCYDLAYRDHIRVAVKEPGSAGLEVDVDLFDDALSRSYGSLCRLVAGAFLSELPELSKIVGFRVNDRSLVAQAALHSLALPIFHDAHHRARGRAIGFASVGASLLQHCLDGEDLDGWFGPFWGESSGHYSGANEVVKNEEVDLAPKERRNGI